MNIYVGNLPYSTTEDDLSSIFANYGEVDRVKIINDRETGRSKGFAFVEMSDDAAARKAIEALNESDMGGRPLKVNEARPRDERPAGGGFGGGGFGGGGQRRGGFGGGHGGHGHGGHGGQRRSFDRDRG